VQLGLEWLVLYVYELTEEVQVSVQELLALDALALVHVRVAFINQHYLLLVLILSIQERPGHLELLFYLCLVVFEDGVGGIGLDLVISVVFGKVLEQLDEELWVLAGLQIVLVLSRV
jgi:hypothetical protein